MKRGRAAAPGSRNRLPGATRATGLRAGRAEKRGRKRTRHDRLDPHRISRDVRGGWGGHRQPCRLAPYPCPHRGSRRRRAERSDAPAAPCRASSCCWASRTDSTRISRFPSLSAWSRRSRRGDTLPAVLLGMPGSTSGQATILDGNPLARQGKAGVALSAAYFASLLGGIIGAFFLFITIPIARPVVNTFSAAEFFVLGLVAIAVVGVVSSGALVRGLMVGAFGLLIASVGYDDATGAHRLTFGPGLPVGRDPCHPRRHRALRAAGVLRHGRERCLHRASRERRPDRRLVATPRGHGRRAPQLAARPPLGGDGRIRRAAAGHRRLARAVAVLRLGASDRARRHANVRNRGHPGRHCAGVRQQRRRRRPARSHALLRRSRLRGHGLVPRTPHHSRRPPGTRHAGQAAAADDDHRVLAGDGQRSGDGPRAGIHSAPHPHRVRAAQRARPHHPRGDDDCGVPGEPRDIRPARHARVRRSGLLHEVARLAAPAHHHRGHSRQHHREVLRHLQRGVRLGEFLRADAGSLHAPGGAHHHHDRGGDGGVHRADAAKRQPHGGAAGGGVRRPRRGRRIFPARRSRLASLRPPAAAATTLRSPPRRRTSLARVRRFGTSCGLLPAGYSSSCSRSRLRSPSGKRSSGRGRPPVCRESSPSLASRSSSSTR